ncbi:putative bifunctional diguanylate cyclase/phosphodiesterase [Oceanobacillus halotolerans]|uniref:putative bifunctional diguanylate cyclase/phosphodiesterase n=1 Tax=Oceanobacillus halotolerans TaxID=2663380 RepID=UPI0013D07801|nr:EAL domain-containing protein [Oceanobacillus halotolerans]
MRYETELNHALKRLKEIEFALNESSMVAITDHRGVIQFANDRFCEVSKYSREELIGNKQNVVNSGHHTKQFFANLWKTISSGNVWKGEIKNKTKDGKYYWVDSTIVPFLDENGEPYQYIAIRHDITKRKRYAEKIERMAYFDALTQLPNRNGLPAWLKEHMNGNRFTAFFLDIDRFKSINDTFGHHIGDLILQEAAKRLKGCLRKTDFIARLGGDEFVILLNEDHSMDHMHTVATKILQAFSFPFKCNSKQIYTSTSIGISTGVVTNHEPSELESFVGTLIKQADTAMYHAKKQGGNSYCFNTLEQNMELERFYQLEQEIKHALTKDEFRIVYQPLVNLTSNQIVGAEALLRWDNPKLGTVSPTEFIPLLEDIGLIIPVGRWVMRSVCHQMKQWVDLGMGIGRIAVNVSPIQFRHEHFISDVRQILNETGLDPHCLELEITENAILHMDKSIKTIETLKELGVKISIDDFGTGYSSLSYLNRLEIDTLKIDKSFIDDLNMDGEIIIDTIIHMGKNLTFNVLAEGIENKEQLAYLKQQDCHEGQGYYWSKPVEADDIPTLFLQKAAGV